MRFLQCALTRRLPRPRRGSSEGWTQIDDFYSAVLPVLGAPTEHGRDINALIDSVIEGGMNTVDPPYTIVIANTKSLDKAILDHLATAKFYLAKARAETHRDFDRDVDATIEIVD